MSPPRPWRGRTRRDLLVLVLVVVLVGLVLFVVVTYGVVVVGGGALLGRLSSPLLGLSVLATAVVALAFDPVQRWLEAVAARLVDGGRPRRTRSCAGSPRRSRVVIPPRSSWAVCFCGLPARTSAMAQARNSDG